MGLVFCLIETLETTFLEAHLNDIYAADKPALIEMNLWLDSSVLVELNLRDYYEVPS